MSRMNYDPTDEPRGYHRYPTPTRRLRRFEHTNQSAKSAVALTKCETIHADGSRTVFRKVRGKVTSVTLAPSTPVTIHRKRAPRTDLGTTLMRAESLGLNVLTVRDEYRHRTDNGYARTTTVDILTNATFRGA